MILYSESFLDRINYSLNFRGASKISGKYNILVPAFVSALVPAPYREYGSKTLNGIGSGKEKNVENMTTVSAPAPVLVTVFYDSPLKCC